MNYPWFLWRPLVRRADSLWKEWEDLGTLRVLWELKERWFWWGKCDQAGSGGHLLFLLSFILKPTKLLCKDFTNCFMWITRYSCLEIISLTCLWLSFLDTSFDHQISLSGFYLAHDFVTAACGSTHWSSAPRLEHVGNHVQSKESRW